ncbi:hypothetical protein [Rugamonas apoptosis]|uniref:Uncharacterized protein n=1 Tax=Rugamonas apoptosis TaxID=2758570 RepID=A0A7W2INB4_9BURK|nr:hypothetical protein [Rugamonas apoptosis]MBA5690558.1 hypothetical protein [Rugamonas apoptosis]
MESWDRFGTEELERLIVEIWRIRAAQAAMRRANRALGRGDLGALRRQGFSERHIVSLLALQQQGLRPFPQSAFRENRRVLGFLMHELERRTTAIPISKPQAMGRQRLGEGASFPEN